MFCRCRVFRPESRTAWATLAWTLSGLTSERRLSLWPGLGDHQPHIVEQFRNIEHDTRFHGEFERTLLLQTPNLVIQAQRPCAVEQFEIRERVLVVDQQIST